ncbi:MAG: hypothetical protein R3F61_23930 [Myxococcota bacterium]
MIWLLAACSGSGVDTSDDTDVVDDTDTPVVPMEETACDDQIDDDQDGAVDCNDSDCFDEELCSWPVAVGFQTDVHFDANFLAELGGYSDCDVVTTSTLQRDRNQSCAGCDRVYCGTFAYPTDTCPQDANVQRPTDGCFGFSFDASTSWTMYGTNPQTSAWELVGTLTGTGPLTLSGSAPLDYEGTEVGTLTTTFYASPN